MAMRILSACCALLYSAESAQHQTVIHLTVQSEGTWWFPDCWTADLLYQLVQDPRKLTWRVSMLNVDISVRFCFSGMSSLLIREGEMLNFASLWNFLVVAEIRLLCHCILVTYLLIAVLTSCNNCLLFVNLLRWNCYWLAAIVTNTAALLCVQQETVCDWWHQKLKMFLQLTAMISYVSKMDRSNM